MAWNRKIRFDDHPSRAIQRHAERSHERRGRRRRPPRARCRPTSRSVAPQHDAVLIDGRHRRPLAHLDAQALQRRARGVAQLRRKRGQNRRRPLRPGRCAPAACRWIGTRRAASGGQFPRACPASSTPVGPPPTSDEREQLLPPRRIRFTLGALEREQDAPANLQGILERLQARRVARPFVVPEVAVARAGGDDQVVVSDSARPRSTALPARQHQSPWPRRAARGRSRACRKIQRIGDAMSPGDSVAVATW